METFAQYTDGEWADGEETFIRSNPATGEALGEFLRGTEADADHAIGAAAERVAVVEVAEDII